MLMQTSSPGLLPSPLNVKRRCRESTAWWYWYYESPMLESIEGRFMKKLSTLTRTPIVTAHRAEDELGTRTIQHRTLSLLQRTNHLTRR